MADLSQWAPFATAAAALIGVGVNFALVSKRQQRLKLAIELEDKIREEQQDDWDQMIYSDTQHIIDRARRPPWIQNMYITSIVLIIVSSWAPDNVHMWLFGAGTVGIVVAVAGFIYAVRTNHRHIKTRTKWMQDEIKKYQIKYETLKSDFKKKNAEMHMLLKRYEYNLRAKGASQKEITVAMTLGADGLPIQSPSDWDSLIKQRENSIPWRIRRTLFRTPPPPLPAEDSAPSIQAPSPSRHSDLGG